MIKCEACRAFYPFSKRVFMLSILLQGVISLPDATSCHNDFYYRVKIKIYTGMKKINR